VLVSAAIKGLLFREPPVYAHALSEWNMEGPGSFKGEWNGKREWGAPIKVPDASLRA